MTLLVIDTCAQECSVALYGERGLCTSITRRIGRGHAEQLMPMIEAALKETSLTYQQLTRLGVTIGPGSFAGVRVGIAAMRALALPLNIPVHGISTLKAITLGYNQPVTAVLDAKRDQVYVQDFGAKGAPFLHTLNTQFEKALTPSLIGSGAFMLANDMKKAGYEVDVLAAPDSISIEEVAAHLWHHTDENEKPEPLYIRPPDAKPAKQLVARI